MYLWFSLHFSHFLIRKKVLIEQYVSIFNFEHLIIKLKYSYRQGFLMFFFRENVDRKLLI